MKRIIYFSCLLIIVTLTSCKKSTPSINDIDGNSYKTKKIGTQIWMLENLKVTKYKNGDLIPHVQDSTQWSNLTTGAWCYYENDPTKGILYNWYAVNDSRGIAPEGWHVPSDVEWSTLSDYLGGDQTSGNKMKSKSGWISNGNGSNTSGFSALPGGLRNDIGGFQYRDYFGYWWTSTESSTFSNTWANVCALYFNDDLLDRFENFKIYGYSVRCIKD
jgi:uncharacterized protein (TIGR02145 family)